MPAAKDTWKWQQAAMRDKEAREQAAAALQAQVSASSTDTTAPQDDPERDRVPPTDIGAPGEDPERISVSGAEASWVREDQPVAGPTLRELCIIQMEREYNACMHFYRKWPQRGINLDELTESYRNAREVAERDGFAEFEWLYLGFKSKAAVILRQRKAPTPFWDPVFDPLEPIVAGIGMSTLPVKLADQTLVRPRFQDNHFDEEDRQHWRSYPFGNDAYVNEFAQNRIASRHEYQPIGHVSPDDFAQPGVHSSFTPINVQPTFTTPAAVASGSNAGNRGVRIDALHVRTPDEVLGVLALRKLSVGDNTAAELEAAQGLVKMASPGDHDSDDLSAPSH